eukprot:g10545.t1
METNTPQWQPPPTPAGNANLPSTPLPGASRTPYGPPPTPVKQDGSRTPAGMPPGTPAGVPPPTPPVRPGTPGLPPPTPPGRPGAPAGPAPMTPPILGTGIKNEST